MESKADRYTVLEIHPKELVDKIEAIQSLGLLWVCQSADYGKDAVRLHVFFDKAGLNNWRSGLYGDATHTIRITCADVKAGNQDAVGAIDGILEMLDY